MFGLSVAEKATKFSVTTLGPMIELSEREFGPFNEFAYDNTYIVGFISTLIRLQSRSTYGDSTRGSTGGKILFATWPQITGRPADGLDTRIFQLIATRDPSFREGGDNAYRFFHAVIGRPDFADPVIFDTVGKQLSSGKETIISILWYRFFVLRIRAASIK